MYFMSWEKFNAMLEIVDPPQNMTPWVSGYGMEEDLLGICN